jgi:two-component system sensor histidine kinase DegS
MGEEKLKEFVEASKKEYEQTKKELGEIEILIQQTSSEVDRLVRRNTQIANRLRHMEANLDTIPRSDIKEMYSAAQDAQKRLFLMKGQLEKLKSNQHNLQKYAELLRNFLDLAERISQEVSPPAEPSVVGIIEAQEKERKWLARRMQNGPAQTLTNLILQAEICERALEVDPEKARTELADLKKAANATFRKVRGFISDLRPITLEDLGIIPTLRRYIEGFARRSGIPTNLKVEGEERRLPSHIEVSIFRIIQELLNNAWQHAQASNVCVTLYMGADTIRATVEDDGRGFDVEEVLSKASKQETFGISAIQERAEMLGGKLDLESRIGYGTKVSFEIPAT